MSIRLFGLVFLVCLGFVQACAANFTFTYGEVTECDDLDVSWTGGTPPFTLTILPSFETKIDVPIPSSAFSNNHGSYTTPMRLRAGNQTVIVMSDSTGFGSGGVSPLITVGNSVKHLACDLKGVPKNDFNFDILTPLAECSNVEFTWDSDVKQPVQITGVVPGGSTFVLNTGHGAYTYNWTADVAANTQILFFLTDADNRQGGTESVHTVLQTGDDSCLHIGSPASATNPPTATSTQTGIVSASAASASRIKTGTLVAAIVVPVVAVTALLIGAIFWYRRRRRNRGVRVLGRKSEQPEVDLAKGDSDAPQHMREAVSPTSTVAFLHGRSPSTDGAVTLSSYSPRLPTSATSLQFPEFPQHPTSVYSDPGHGYPYGAMSAYGSSHGGSSQYGGAPGPAVPYASVGSADSDGGARRKAAEVGVLTPPGHQAPAHFILHTDIADSVSPPPVREVVELPPQYSERHAGTTVPSATDSLPPAGDLSSTHV